MHRNKNEKKQISLLPLTIETVVSFDKISMERSETERIDRIPTKDGRRDIWHDDTRYNDIQRITSLRISKVNVTRSLKGTQLSIKLRLHLRISHAISH